MGQRRAEAEEEEEVEGGFPSQKQIAPLPTPGQAGRVRAGTAASPGYDCHYGREEEVE